MANRVILPLPSPPLTETHPRLFLPHSRDLNRHGEREEGIYIPSLETVFDSRTIRNRGRRKKSTVVLFSRSQNFRPNVISDYKLVTHVTRVVDGTRDSWLMTVRSH